MNPNEISEYLGQQLSDKIDAQMIAAMKGVKSEVNSKPRTAPIPKADIYIEEKYGITLDELHNIIKKSNPELVI